MNVLKPSSNRHEQQYGGRYGPLYTAYFNAQNAQIDSCATHEVNETPIYIETLGIINGCVDMATQGAFYPRMAYNNTYGIRAITKSESLKSTRKFLKSGGCLETSLECRQLAAALDPQNLGNNFKVNQACGLADIACYDALLKPFLKSGVSMQPHLFPAHEMVRLIVNLKRNPFDITQQPTTTWPPPFLVGFFNQQWVQADLGVPVNFTVSSNAVTNG